MRRIVTQALGLMGIYLLVMTSAKPGDVVTGLLLGLVPPWRCARGGRPAAAGSAPRSRPRAGTTAIEMARGTWRTARFCLRGGGSPGFVEIPRGDVPAMPSRCGACSPAKRPTRSRSTSRTTCSSFT